MPSSRPQVDHSHAPQNNKTMPQVDGAGTNVSNFGIARLHSWPGVAKNTPPGKRLLGRSRAEDSPGGHHPERGTSLIMMSEVPL